MVSTFTWVLVGVVAYTILGMVLRTRGLLPESVRLSGPITTLHTKRGRQLLGQLARPKRFWRAWGNVGFGLGLVVMVGSFLVVLLAGYQAIVNPQPTQLNEPRNVLAIPGVNEFLPLAVAPEIVTGLVIGLIVHEGGHGLFCRVEDIDIESMGLALLTIIPIGAFVEPDEDDIQRSRRGSQVRMFAAGVTNNFAVSLIAFLLLFGPVMGSFAVVDGAAVGGTLPGSSADAAGVDRGTVITGVDGQSVTSARDLEGALANSTSQSVELQLQDGESVTVERSVQVTGAVASAPLGTNDTILAVNGTAVHTESQFRQAAQNHTVANLTTRSGGVTMPLGAFTRITPDGALASEGAPPEGSLVVTEIDGERIVDQTDLQRALDGRQQGDSVTVVGYIDGEQQRYDVTLGSGGTIGVAVSPGIGGLVVDDFGVEYYPAASILEILGGNAEQATGTDSVSFPQRVILTLVLPFAGVTTGLGYNFPGFTGFVTEFYEVGGLLGVFGDGVGFLLTNVLFWTAWINLIIGQFNLVPTYPLDGGHILRASVESVVARLPIERKHSLTTAVTGAITVTMIASLLLMVFGPRLLT
jgi:membrane-associated protease RseP (regulator of RpoE activity)